MKTTTRLIPILLALNFLCSAAAYGDLLVTQDGSRVETDGEWKVEGRRVVFTLPNGTLSALRLSEVDLEASRAATEKAMQAAEAPPEDEAERPKPEPVLVLTNKDIPKAVPQSVDDGDGLQPPDRSESAELRVIEWNSQTEGSGTLMTGRLENATGRLQNRIQLTVEVRNDDDELMATSPAILAQGSLVSGGITVFRARFPELPELPGTPHFVITSSDYTVRGGATGGDSDDDTDDSDTDSDG